MVSLSNGETHILCGDYTKKSPTQCACRLDTCIATQAGLRTWLDFGVKPHCVRSVDLKALGVGNPSPSSWRTLDWVVTRLSLPTGGKAERWKHEQHISNLLCMQTKVECSFDVLAFDFYSEPFWDILNQPFTDQLDVGLSREPRHVTS